MNTFRYIYIRIVCHTSPHFTGTMSLLDEEDLKRIKAQVLVHMRRDLVKNIDARRLLTFLRSKYVLDERDCDEIKNKPSREACTEVFIDILSRKGPRGYDEFCSAILHDKTQTFLLTAMNKTLEVMKARVLELKTKTKAIPLDTPFPSARSMELESPQMPSPLPHMRYQPCEYLQESYNPRHANNRPFAQMYTRSVTSDVDSDTPCGQSLPLRFSCKATP